MRERFTVGTSTNHQDNRIEYDRLGRVIRVKDHYYDLTYGYDAAGNRRYAGTLYYDQNTADRTLTSWYTYDGMNRIVLSQGILLGNTIQITNASGGSPVNAQKVVVSYDGNGNRVATVSGTVSITAPQGVNLAYDGAANRRTAASYQGGSLVTETYEYDANNRLTNTNRAGTLTSSRVYDWADRVTETTSYSSPGTVSERRTYAYNYKGWLTLQQTYNGAGTLTQKADYWDDAGDATDNLNGYDNAGNLKQYKVSVYTGTAYTNTYAYTYTRYDSYKETQVAGSSTYFLSGNTTTAYDPNGNAKSVTESFMTSKSRTFVADTKGQILNKTENGNIQRYFFANDKPIGSSGALAPADFDYNYTPVSDRYPAATPGGYVVSAGDTLKGIALTVFGDAALWYLIADANGMSSDAGLVVGKNLVIPNRITNIHNDYTTFKPYSAREIDQRGQALRSPHEVGLYFVDVVDKV